MDTAFFWASKLFWAVASPDSLLLILFLAAWALLMLGMQRVGRRVLAAGCLLLLLIAFLPLGEWLIYPLEKRFPVNPSLPPQVDGIIVLGGTTDPALSTAWGQIETNDTGERLHAFQRLARQYPDAKLLFSGGNGSLATQEYKEADSVVTLFQEWGMAEREVILESESRNTWENVILSKVLANPQPQEHWIMITSAFHMPRAMGIFCSQQWPVQPWPVDHHADRLRLLRIAFNLAEHLDGLKTATREWVGLLAYFLTGKTQRLLPGVNSICSAS